MKSLCVRVKSEALATASPRDTTRYDTFCKPSLLLGRSGSPARQERPTQPYSWKSTRCSRSRKARTSRAKVRHGKGEGEDTGNAEKRTLGKAGAAVKQDTWVADCRQRMIEDKVHPRRQLWSSLEARDRHRHHVRLRRAMHTHRHFFATTYTSRGRSLFSFNSNGRCRGAKAAMVGGATRGHHCFDTCVTRKFFALLNS